MPDLDDTTRHSLTPAWDLTQERASRESAVSQRFNAFLIFFSVVVLAAVSARSRGHLLIVLSVGSVTALGLASSLLRAHRELDSLLRQLSLDPTHPVSMNDGQFGASLNWITGWLLPFGCTLGLFFAAAAAYQGSLTHGGAAEEVQIREAVTRIETLRQEVATLKAESAQTSLDLNALRAARVEKAVSAPAKGAPPSVPARKAASAPAPSRKPDPKATPKRQPPGRAKPTPTPHRPRPTH